MEPKRLFPLRPLGREKKGKQNSFGCKGVWLRYDQLGPCLGVRLRDFELKRYPLQALASRSSVAIRLNGETLRRVVLPLRFFKDTSSWKHCGLHV